MCIVTYTGYTIVMRSQHYLTYPVSTKLGVVAQHPMSFPAVTICNMNRVTASYAKKKPFVKDVLFAISPVTALTADLNLSDPGVASKMAAIDTYDLMRNGSHPFESMYFECQWESITVECKKYFVMTTTSMGMCHTFNSAEFIEKKGRMSVASSGVNYALSLKLNVEQFDYYFQSGSSAGFKVNSVTASLAIYQSKYVSHFLEYKCCP